MRVPTFGRTTSGSKNPNRESVPRKPWLNVRNRPGEAIWKVPQQGRSDWRCSRVVPSYAVSGRAATDAFTSAKPTASDRWMSQAHATPSSLSSNRIKRSEVSSCTRDDGFRHAIGCLASMITHRRAPWSLSTQKSPTWHVRCSVHCAMSPLSSLLKS